MPSRNATPLRSEKPPNNNRLTGYTPEGNGLVHTCRSCWRDACPLASQPLCTPRTTIDEAKWSSYALSPHARREVNTGFCIRWTVSLLSSYIQLGDYRLLDSNPDRNAFVVNYSKFVSKIHVFAWNSTKSRLNYPSLPHIHLFVRREYYEIL